ncbi:MAG: hypothetical protein PHH30_03570 [Bacteroidales bacterium]|nr:hypothetical protein [Bacteroidales bacterium]
MNKRTDEQKNKRITNRGTIEVRISSKETLAFSFALALNLELRTA